MFIIKKIIKDIGRWIFWYPFRIIAQHLPLGISYFIAEIKGGISYRVSSSKKKIMDKELSLIFDDAISETEKEKIKKETFENIAKDKVESLFFPLMNKDNIDTFITIEGEEKIQSALERKRGIVVLLSHFGQNRLIMPALGYRGYRVNQIAAPITAWTDLVDKRLITPIMKKTLNIELEYEKLFPVKFIYYNELLRDAFIALKNNEIVIIAMDGGAGENRVPVDFLSRKAFFPIGALKLAHKTGARAIPMFVRRNKDNSHTVIVENEIKINFQSAAEQNYQHELQEFISVLEKYVKLYPAHYLKHLLIIQEQIMLGRETFMTDSKQ